MLLRIVIYSIYLPGNSPSGDTARSTIGRYGRAHRRRLECGPDEIERNRYAIHRNIVQSYVRLITGMHSDFDQLARLPRRTSR